MLEHILSWLPFRVYHEICGNWGLTPSDYNGFILALVRPSTITVGGRFTGVILDDRTDVPKFRAEKPILLIGSNFAKQIAEGYTLPTAEVKTSNRGRKPKVKDRKKRCQGNGKYFNSQISFFVAHPHPKNAAKIYKCKIFRNGVFQIGRAHV